MEGKWWGKEMFCYNEGPTDKPHVLLLKNLGVHPPVPISLPGKLKIWQPGWVFPHGNIALVRALHPGEDELSCATAIAVGHCSLCPQPTHVLTDRLHDLRRHFSLCSYPDRLLFWVTFKIFLTFHCYINFPSYVNISQCVSRCISLRRGQSIQPTFTKSVRMSLQQCIGMLIPQWASNGEDKPTLTFSNGSPMDLHCSHL